MRVHFIGAVKHASQKLVSLCLHEPMESLEIRTTSDDFVEEFPILFEPIAIPREGEGLIPANQLTSHHQHWSVRVDIAASVQKFRCMARIVENDESLPEEGHGNDVTCVVYAGMNSSRTTHGHRFKRTPFLRPVCEGQPFVRGRHLMDISNDWEPFRSWWKGQLWFQAKSSDAIEQEHPSHSEEHIEESDGHSGEEAKVRPVIPALCCGLNTSLTAYTPTSLLVVAHYVC